MTKQISNGMNRKNKNDKTSIISVAIILFAVAVLVYFLFKTSLDTSNKTATVNNSAGGSLQGASISKQLSSLVGNPMPDIQLADKDGKVYKTPDFKGKNTVLFFSEGLMCYPACWDQIASFGEDERFNTDQIQAISILADSAEDWQKAIAEMPKLAKARTLFDENAATSRRLGMLTTASSMHRGMLPGHTYVLLNKDGIVNYIFDDPNMAIANDMLLRKIEELNK
ncbi:hypothetical protein A2Z53_02420 [Candidatus Giovannonibacteria bacterium RIFCSPHIGHO2_02_42_15]|uniref:Thioredoxin domain-containing protein n=2 Tax=Candidatus Giovannoniibacteriota TaxID=1752738 RepID=A0A1F5VPH3_9BACT|nr:MAG: hypothetical protein UV11_C0006G0010 [Candidatus Giovannonibacteria bacterium GW2011_GWF2_42_19]OGF65344.1 MAG: hypothetical protein A2Z53_02420 [Candidatus Giovannonibacteria bacterium RIFCSPHIGHO2_02_42_15]